MPENEKLQRPIRTPVVTCEKPVEEPFVPPPPHLFTPKEAKELHDAIPQPFPLPSPRIPPTPTLVEEQYEPVERMVLGTSTTQAHYDIKTEKPKQILLIAEDTDHLVEFNRSVDDLSTKIFTKGSLGLPGKGIRSIYAKTVTGTGKLYIRIWGP